MASNPINWRKWNRILHRDLGYFFFGMTVIYALSGIALNHIRDRNPNYDIRVREVMWNQAGTGMSISRENVLDFLDRYGEKKNYKKHYFPEAGKLHIFLKNGNAAVDLATGRGMIEKLNKRPIFYQVNFLHYNPGRVWTWFSDVFCVSLILVAITGLFILKGKHGITRRGAWLTGAGLLIPIVFLILRLG